MQTTNISRTRERLIYTSLGALLSAFGLEMFLTPNQIISGGVTGISGLLSHMTEMQMGVFLFFLNLPFIFQHTHVKGMKWKKVVLTVIGLSLLSILTILLHPFPPLIENTPLAAFCGSLILGIGIGLIFQYSGFTDGVQQVAYIVKKRVLLSIAEIVMLSNLMVLAFAGFIFGWDQAIYSIFGYVITMKTTEYTISLLSRHQAIVITTVKPHLIRDTIKSVLGTKVEFVSPDFPEARREELFLMIPSRQEKLVRAIVTELDPSATISSTTLPTLPDKENHNTLQG